MEQSTQQEIDRSFKRIQATINQICLTKMNFDSTAALIKQKVNSYEYY